MANKTIKKIRHALIKAQVQNGLLCPHAAATKQASYTLQGETLTNLVYLRSGKIFQMDADHMPDLRVDGVVSGCEVTSLSADNVEVAAGVAYVAGVEVIVNADASNTVTRPASGKYAVYAITVSSAGSLAITKGADGDSLDLTGGYGGAGQKPYVDGVAVLAYFWAYSNGAAVIPVDQILAGETANVDHDWLPIHGGVALYDALLLNRTGGISRPVYIQCYDLASGGALQVIGTVSDGTLTIMRDAPTETTSGRSRWKKYDFAGLNSWNADFTRFRTDEYWIEKMLDPNSDKFFLEIKEDRLDAFKYQGVGVIQGSLSLALKRGVVTEKVSFQGDDELLKVAA